MSKLQMFPSIILTNIQTSQKVYKWAIHSMGRNQKLKFIDVHIRSLAKKIYVYKVLNNENKLYYTNTSKSFFLHTCIDLYSKIEWFYQHWIKNGDKTKWIKATLWWIIHFNFVLFYHNSIFYFYLWTDISLYF